MGTQSSKSSNASESSSEQGGSIPTSSTKGRESQMLEKSDIISVISTDGETAVRLDGKHISTKYHPRSRYFICDFPEYF